MSKTIVLDTGNARYRSGSSSRRRKDTHIPKTRHNATLLCSEHHADMAPKIPITLTVGIGVHDETNEAAVSIRYSGFQDPPATFTTASEKQRFQSVLADEKEKMLACVNSLFPMLDFTKIEPDQQAKGLRDGAVTFEVLRNTASTALPVLSQCKMCFQTVKVEISNGELSVDGEWKHMRSVSIEVTKAVDLSRNLPTLQDAVSALTVANRWSARTREKSWNPNSNSRPLKRLRAEFYELV